MAKHYHLAEHHLFGRFDKQILFNVETMLFYEVTPVVSDVVASLEKSPEADPVAQLGKRYGRWEIRNAISYLEKEGFFVIADGDYRSISARYSKKGRASDISSFSLPTGATWLADTATALTGRNNGRGNPISTVLIQGECLSTRQSRA